jgi:hypothetical protein
LDEAFAIRGEPEMGRAKKFEAKEEQTGEEKGEGEKARKSRSASPKRNLYLLSPLASKFGQKAKEVALTETATTEHATSPLFFLFRHCC